MRKKKQSLKDPLNALKINGYLKLPQLLSRESIDLIKEKAPHQVPNRESNLYNFFKSKRLRSKTNFTKKNLCVDSFPVIGSEDDLNKIIEQILESKRIKGLLQPIIGSSYYLYTCHVRKALKSDYGTGIHQDCFGQFTIAIKLNDTKTGLTRVVKGSHYWPKCPNHFEGIPADIHKLVSTPLMGSPGDAFLFFNKTWHLRESCQDPSNDTLLICLDVKGYPSYNNQIFNKSDSYWLQKCLGTNFQERVLWKLYNRKNSQKIPNEKTYLNAITSSSSKKTFKYFYILSYAQFLILIGSLFRTTFKILRIRKK